MVKNAAETTGISQKTVVQMYENLFNKSKYQRGRRPSNETWVFGIVDTSTILAISYMEAVAKRDKATLL
jgi:hypothetical protein